MKKSLGKWLRSWLIAIPVGFIVYAILVWTGAEWLIVDWDTLHRYRWLLVLAATIILAIAAAVALWQNKKNKRK